jgi:PLP dependent protein
VTPGSVAADALAGRLASIRQRVGRAAESAGRDPQDVHLLAVTKGHPVSAVDAALSLGLREIGESRVQEAQAKHAACAGRGISWHMIGHLQRNKARVAASLFDTVQSLDSAALAIDLARHRGTEVAPLRVLIEVELTGLPGRTGTSPDEAAAVLEVVRGLAALAPAGLMTIAPPGLPEAAQLCFERLRELREALRQTQGIALDELSMGMSDDYEIAIAHGATVIRLGRALFGDRAGPGR